MPETPTAPSIDHPLAEEARAWLIELQECVRAVDYERARKLFAEDVVSFGTQVNSIEIRLDEVEREQWHEVWPRVRSFTYRLEDVRCFGDEGCLIVLVPWQSVGVRADNTTYERDGRTTFVLARRDGRWVCVHFHSSLVVRP